MPPRSKRFSSSPTCFRPSKSAQITAKRFSSSIISTNKARRSTVGASNSCRNVRSTPNVVAQAHHELHSQQGVSSRQKKVVFRRNRIVFEKLSDDSSAAFLRSVWQRPWRPFFQQVASVGCGSTSDQVSHWAITGAHAIARRWPGSCSPASCADRCFWSSRHSGNRAYSFSEEHMPRVGSLPLRDMVVIAVAKSMLA